MDLAFDNRRLRELCENESKAQERYGITIALALKNRLSDLEAAEWVEEIPIGRPTEFFDGHESKYRIEITGALFLVLSCAHLKPPRLVDGSINWRKVRKVKVLSISK